MIPNYLLERVGGFPFGYRHEKRPKPNWVAMVATSNRPTYRGARNLANLQEEIARDFELRTKHGFENWEFRFFGSEWLEDVAGTTPMIICRGCGELFNHVKRRREHVAECSARILGAYEFLVNNQSCFTCGKIGVTGRKFGVPFCTNTKCLRDFKYECVQSHIFNTALFVYDDNLAAVQRENAKVGK